MAAVPDDVPPPHPTGRIVEGFVSSLTGKLFPWDGVQPVLLRMPGSPHLYLPLFSTAGELEEVMERAKTPWKSIKKVEDGAEFLQSILEQKRLGEGAELKVITNISFLPNGRVRFVELKEN